MVDHQLTDQETIQNQDGDAVCRQDSKMNIDPAGNWEEEDQKKELVASLSHTGIELDQKKILEGIDLKIYPDSRIAVMGESGIGKSTILKILAGILEPTEGEVLRPEKISMVFDQEGLYPLLSAMTNIQLGIDWSACPRKERKDKARKWGKMFNCESFWDQPVSTLSAGQRKRIALARAMMKEPQLLLLDEIFHALDGKLRTQIMETVKVICQEKQIALVFATHDPAEAEFFEAQIFQLEPLTSDSDKADL